MELSPEEAALLAPKGLYGLLRQIPAIVVVLSGPEHVFEFASAKYQEMVGSERVLLGLPVVAALPEIARQGFVDLLDRVYRTGIPYEGREVAVRLDPSNTGSYETRYVDFTYQPLTSADGKVNGIFVHGVDITHHVVARRAAEDAAAKATGQVMFKSGDSPKLPVPVSNAEMQHFTQVAIHDIKAPVRKIKVFSNLLRQKKEELSSSAENYQDKVETAALHISQLVEGIVRYLSVSTSEYAIRDVDLSKVFGHVTQDLAARIEEKNAVVEAEQLPVIQGSEELLYHLFHQLITNSLVFSRPDVQLRISVSSGTDLQQGFVSITVQDNGMGFRPEFRARIFEAFARLNAREQYEGLGLGLSICKKIVERHRGEIEAIGEENGGAAFIMRLPLRLHS